MSTIRTKIIRAFIVLIVLSIIIFTFFSLNSIEKNAEKRIPNHFREIGKEIYYNISSKFLNAYNRINILKADEVISGHFSKSMKRKRLLYFKELFKDYEDISLIDKKGNLILSTDYKFIGNWKENEYFKLSLKKKFVVSRVYMMPFTHERFISFLAPVIKNNKILFIIVFYLNMRDIESSISQFKIGETGEAILVDQYGKIIASKREDYVLDNFSDHYTIKKNNLLSFLKNDYIYASYPGNKKNGFTKMPDWTIYVIQKKDEAFSFLNPLIFRFIIFGIFLIVIVIFIGSKLANNIAMPIKYITQIADAIRNGDYKKKIILESTDEIEVLAKTFNSMTDKLTSTITELDLIMNTVPDAIIVYDYTTKFITKVNDMATSIFGYEKEKLLFLSILKLFPDIEQAENDFTQEILTGNGDRVICNVRKSEMKLNNRKYILLAVTDITEKIKQADEIKKLKSYLQNIIESMPSALISVDENSVITQWNQAAVNFFGVFAQDALGKKIWDIIPDFEEYKNIYKDIIENKEVKRFHKKVVLSDEERYEDIYCYPLIANGVKGMVVRIDDVTELEKKDKQLKHAQRMELIGTLSSGVAHDFNNILASIIGSISILRYKLEHDVIKNNDEIIKYLDIVALSSEKGARLVKQLLTLAKKHDLNYEKCDLRKIIEETVNVCKNTFDRSIEIRTDIIRDVECFSFCDKAQIEQVFLNIAINASHAMTIMRKDKRKWGGVLTISLSKFYADEYFLKTHPEAKKTDYALISIEDTGVGMDKKTMAKIFDPFFTTKDLDKGTGLGLATVQTIIHDHDGFIDVYSEVGIGTKFNIYLPIKNNGKVSSDSDFKHHIVKGEGTILIVDDEDTVLELSKEVLEEAGYKLLTARNAGDALEIFDKNKDDIDLVLLDLVLPGESGDILFEKLKKIKSDVKVVVSSGFARDERLNRILKNEKVAFVQKPYSIYNLSKTINDMLSK